MKRLALFILPALLISAVLQLREQHATGMSWLPQQQVVTTAAAAVHQSICGK
jgi:hypothetical protein